MTNSAIYSHISSAVRKYSRAHKRPPERIFVSRRLYLELWRQCGTSGDQLIATVEADGLIVCDVPVSVYPGNRPEYYLAEERISLWHEMEANLL